MAQRVAVVGGAQRGGDVAIAVKTVDILLRQEQLVHGDIRADARAQLFGVADLLGAAGGGQAAEMHVRAGGVGERQHAGDFRGFGGFRDAGQAQPCGNNTIINTTIT